MRVGQGVDAHRFGGSGPLRLGGVTIASDSGLLAHSDGDVLLHAITDAVLGAAAAGDIGSHFPDSDPRYAGADSRELLREAVGIAAARGLAVVNADATVVAERPRLAAHIPAMREAIAADLGIAPEAVGVKATTTEGMGFTGRGEGIAAFAVVLLDER